jgi:hypothetical protein
MIRITGIKVKGIQRVSFMMNGILLITRYTAYYPTPPLQMYIKTITMTFENYLLINS